MIILRPIPFEQKTKQSMMSTINQLRFFNRDMLINRSIKKELSDK